MERKRRTPSHGAPPCAASDISSLVHAGTSFHSAGIEEHCGEHHRAWHEKLPPCIRISNVSNNDEAFGGIRHAPKPSECALPSLCNVQISAGCTHSCDHCAIFHYLGVFHLPVASGVTDGDHYLFAAGRQKHVCQQSVHYLCTNLVKSDTQYLDRLG